MEPGMAKCPKCERPISEASGERCTIRVKRSKWHGLMCACPFCGTVLGVSIDPIALKDDLKRELLQEIGH
jgi:hypothetical protein